MIGYWALLRPGELAGSWMPSRRSHTLRRQDVRVVTTRDGREVSVFLRSSKTDQAAAGVTLFLKGRPRDPLCPIRALEEYERVSSGDGSAFLRDEQGRPVTSQRMVALVQAALRQARVGAVEKYTGHSLRIGGASDRFEEGESLEDLRKAGRWAPGSGAVLTYIRRPDGTQRVSSGEGPTRARVSEAESGIPR